MTNPYQTPQANVPLDENSTPMAYAGFWIRAGASIIDTILILMVTSPLLYMFYGSQFLLGESFIQGPADVVISYVLPAVASVLFWIYKSATPGKMLMGIRIVDAETGGRCSTGQLIGRYLGYYPSMLFLMFGFLWVAFDKRKQGWHDKLAGTLVIRN
ncbi:MAG: RDD family protein [Gammaproteobacteria bacterium HGW-Gammaproteobacteria-14]|nr:MAG: RDD family protein [Gammaproteobacteria bacterium HGW-Gammaproteobacteria-14]